MAQPTSPRENAFILAHTLQAIGARLDWCTVNSVANMSACLKVRYPRRCSLTIGIASFASYPHPWCCLHRSLQSSSLRLSRRSAVPFRGSRKAACSVRATAEPAAAQPASKLILQWEQDTETPRDVFAFGGSAPERGEAHSKTHMHGSVGVWQPKARAYS